MRGLIGFSAVVEVAALGAGSAVASTLCSRCCTMRMAVAGGGMFCFFEWNRMRIPAVQLTLAIRCDEYPSQHGRS